jgi:hypothetical protein
MINAFGKPRNATENVQMDMKNVELCVFHQTAGIPQTIGNAENNVLTNTTNVTENV